MFLKQIIITFDNLKNVMLGFRIINNPKQGVENLGLTKNLGLNEKK